MVWGTTILTPTVEREPCKLVCEHKHCIWMSYRTVPERAACRIPLLQLAMCCQGLLAGFSIQESFPPVGAQPPVMQLQVCQPSFNLTSAALEGNAADVNIIPCSRIAKERWHRGNKAQSCLPVLRLQQLVQCHRLMKFQIVWWSFSHRAKY